MLRCVIVPLLVFFCFSCFALDDSRLPDGREFQFWEKPLQFTKSYYVDGKAANADDNGPGSRERPFRTIGKAAQVLQPGERVIIAEGVYREAVCPARGGTGPERMISYEAAEGAKVVIKGSVVLKDGWKPSSGWQLRRQGTDSGEREPRIWEIRLDGRLFGGYNPFGMLNMPQQESSATLLAYTRHRGMVFVDGKPLEQVRQYGELAGPGLRGTLTIDGTPRSAELFRELGGGEGRFWAEHNGMVLHVRLPGDDSPDKHVIEVTTKEQVFAPVERHLGYIRVRGITFEHAANGFPVPQKGLVSTNRGHHWIIEGNTIQWANSIGLDVGKEHWSATTPEIPGYHVIRGNIIRYCGISGISGISPEYLLVEDNLIEWVGWQDAEYMMEAAGVKFHNAKNILFRGNVVRHLRHAFGIWWDVGNVNCRLTRNVFADILTRRAAMLFENTYEQNQVDNNLIWGIRRADTSVAGDTDSGIGIFIFGTDRLIVAQNLIAACENSAVYSRTVETRIVGSRAGTARNNRVHNNVFYDCGQSAIGFANEHNEADGNLYGKMRGGFLRVLFFGRPQLLDLPTWREIYGWDKSGQMAEMEGAFDPATLQLTFLVKGEMPTVSVFNDINTDFFGNTTGTARPPGPFGDLKEAYRAKIVDPRRPSLTGSK